MSSIPCPLDQSLVVYLSGQLVTQAHVSLILKPPTGQSESQLWPLRLIAAHAIQTAAALSGQCGSSAALLRGQCGPGIYPRTRRLRPARFTKPRFAALAIRGPRILRPTRLMSTQPMSFLGSHSLVLSGRVKTVHSHLLRFLTLIFNN